MLKIYSHGTNIVHKLQGQYVSIALYNLLIIYLNKLKLFTFLIYIHYHLHVLCCCFLVALCHHNLLLQCK
uniref:Uncharacterized protein n=1 Tax=Anguilla anguilla TaxID=7936 RepID=A0A0E9XX69_ANGAN